MKLLFMLAFGLALTLPAAGLTSQTPAAPVRVLFQTSMGDIEIEVESSERLPATVNNFLKYVDAELYDDGRFHRTVRLDNQPDNAVKIEVIQGAATNARPSDFFPPIPLERTNFSGLSHKDGTVSMARSTPDSARHEFFICIGDQPELDWGGKRNADGQGFAAFGRVVRGMDVVRKIQAAPANAQTLTPPIQIIKARRVAPRLLD